MEGKKYQKLGLHTDEESKNDIPNDMRNEMPITDIELQDLNAMAIQRGQQPLEFVNYNGKSKLFPQSF
jgi:hypothetical protein